MSDRDRQTLQLLMDAIPQAVQLLDRDGQVVVANRRAAVALEAFPINCRGVARQVVASREVVYTEEIRDGGRFALSASPVLAADGAVSHILVCASSGSDELQLDVALRLQRDIALLLGSNLELEQILQQVLRTLLRLEPLDRGSVHLFDETTGELRLLVHEGLSPGLVARISRLAADSPEARVIREGRPLFVGLADLRGELRWVAREGDLCSAAALPVLHTGENLGCLVLGSSTDVVVPVAVRSTLESVASLIGGLLVRHRGERAQAALREQLMHGEKLRALGTLAGGVAHEMNNLLAVVLGLASQLRETSPADDPQAAVLENIIAAAEQGGELTRSLLGFARKTRVHFDEVELNRIVREQQRIVQRTVGKVVTIASDLAGDLAPVRGDASMLAQLVLNLCVNAVDAMPDGGQLLLRTANEEVDAGRAATRPGVHAGPHVRLEVVDTGVGMTEEVRDRACEPFFTTKGPDRGTGLGLALVFGTVKEHGGDIDIASAPDRGTTVTVRLPALARHARAPAARAVTGAKARQGLRVLLVDDERLVRRTGELMLKSLGYEVLLAEHGQAALDIFQSGASVDLVILDLTMPGMDGATCFARLRALDPTARVIISSGHVSDGHQEAIPGDGHTTFLDKPFNMCQLADAIARVMERDP